MPPRKNHSPTSAGTAKPQPSKTNGEPKKRKAANDDEAGGVKTAKRSRASKGSAQAGNDLRQTEISTKSTSELEKAIIINRAPVLELWGACVAQFQYPDFSWDLCLSIGSSISTITAISKGRSIGTIAPPDESKDAASKDQNKKNGDDLPTVKVMGFPMKIKDDSVIVKGKPKTTREVSLVRKYGSEESYGKAKNAMTEALQDWKGKENELDLKAFHMYEQFRPDVAKGQKGWGRKGELHLSKVRDTIRK
ncbi:hypothetical protein INS49_003662 [Diaporthe citri]|uniref:uncharacterized protein n=1 Tax=Diaporthe citri TaxID=83186 RepID=UPI001C7FD952|nr:uncharacterized protein INS49_003662 [Diaporthe citri]KAG6355698.1 hypothetical protein INS49_003662 [Diaporthe citri]